MNLLNKLTKKNLILNKKRTTVTIVGIILSVALITALATLVISFKYSVIEFEKKRSGDYHVAFGHVLSNDVEKFKNSRFVQDVYFSKEIGYSELNGLKNEDKPYVYVSAYDFKALDKMVKANLISGRLPQTSDEILIPRHLKTNGRVSLNVGDIVTLGIGKRFADDNSVLEQNNPYNKDQETFKEEYKREYKIVGIIERPNYSIEPYSAPGYTFITCLDDVNESMYTAYVRYEHKYLKEPYYTTANILGVNQSIYKKAMTLINYDSEDEYNALMEEFSKEMEKARYNVVITNTYLMSLEYQNLNDSMMRALYFVALIVTLIIMVTSIYCIKNSFNISITEKTKQYGMLASIGATKRQIKKNVLYEAFVLGIISLPIGILSGMLASFILIKVSTYILDSALGLNLIYKVSFSSILLSVILGAVTIYLSAIKSARKASKVSPISAIRNNDDIKINSKKIKSPKIIKKMFGVGGDVSYKNLKRNNKKYRTTVISIVVCVSVFVALSSFINLAFRAVDLSFENISYNIRIHFSLKDSKKANDLREDILNIEGINDYSVNNTTNFLLKDPKFTSDYMELEGKYVEEILKNDGVWGISLLSVGDYQYRKYIQSLGLKYEDVFNKVIILNNALVYTYDEKSGSSKKHEVELFDYKPGDKLSGSIFQTNCTEEDVDKCWIDSNLQVAFSTFKQPFGQDLLYSQQYTMIVSDEFMEKYLDEHYSMTLDVLNPDKFQDEAEKILASATDYDIYNVDKEKKTGKSLFTLVAIFLYGFIIVIALIGITNIFNTISTSVELRAREFATLKSVGMTKKEFNKMISLESMFYGCKSLIIGIPIGSLLSYLIYYALVGGDLSFSYEYPFKAVVIVIIAVLVLVSIIMKYSIRKINKQNTIETIRNDNI